MTHVVQGANKQTGAEASEVAENRTARSLRTVANYCFILPILATVCDIMSWFMYQRSPGLADLICIIAFISIWIASFALSGQAEIIDLLSRR